MITDLVIIQFYDIFGINHCFCHNITIFNFVIVVQLDLKYHLEFIIFAFSFFLYLECSLLLSLVLQFFKLNQLFVDQYFK